MLRVESLCLGPRDHKDLLSVTKFRWDFFPVVPSTFLLVEHLPYKPCKCFLRTFGMDIFLRAFWQVLSQDAFLGHLGTIILKYNHQGRECSSILVWMGKYKSTNLINQREKSTGLWFRLLFPEFKNSPIPLLCLYCFRRLQQILFMLCI